MLTREIEVIKCHNHNMAVLITLIANNTAKSLQMHENWGYKMIISLDAGYISHILTLPSIICVFV